MSSCDCMERIKQLRWPYLHTFYSNGHKGSSYVHNIEECPYGKSFKDIGNEYRILTGLSAVDDVDAFRWQDATYAAGKATADIRKISINGIEFK